MKANSTLQILEVISQRIIYVTGRGKIFIISLKENNIARSDLKIGDAIIIDNIKYSIRDIEGQLDNPMVGILI